MARSFSKFYIYGAFLLGKNKVNLFNIGRGVVVAVLDTGLEWTHPDLRKNYDPSASYDFNDLDEDPTPRYDWKKNNDHGTSVAGLIAAQGQNSICTIGIAHNSRIGGIRMLDGRIVDKTQAESFTHALGHVGIYVASWGPKDDGEIVKGPGPNATAALKLGTDTVPRMASININVTISNIIVLACTCTAIV